MTVRAVFIFDRDDWCSVFASPDEAAANLEINDVESHEYAGFTDDGRVVTPIVEQEDVRVVVTDRRDVDGLQLRLQGCRRHHGFESAIDDFFDLYPGMPHRIPWQDETPPVILFTGNR